LAAEQRAFRAALTAERRAAIASRLSVSEAALDAVNIGVAQQADLRRLRASGAGWRESYPVAVSSFPECDASGAIVGLGFRADDGRKGAPSGKVGAKRGLIIPSTLATRPDPVLLVEGPTDVAACETLGLAAVGRPSNAAGSKMIASLLGWRAVLVVGENDQNPAGSWPGRDGAQKLARSLAATWKQPVNWTLPPAASKDARAHLQRLVAEGLDPNDAAACRAAGERFVEELLAQATLEQPDADPASPRGGDCGAAEMVVRLCTDAGDELFHDNEQRAFVVVRERGIVRTLAVRSREYQLLLSRRYFRCTESVLPSTARAEALGTLEGLAVFEGPEYRVFTRVGEIEGNVVLDLCDKEWRVVVIGPDGWRIVNESPIRFRRAAGMLPLPVPERGGSINELRAFLNVRTDRDFALICGFIIGALNPTGPFFILLVNGEQGSAKSTLCRLIRALVDPNKAALRAESKDDRDLAIAANNAWMIGLDNISRLSERVSNALCRLATGGGFATRQLYCDLDEVIFDARRPILINGIGEVAERSDLLDRTIRLTLQTIPEEQRRTERAIMSEFEGRHPAILGAFLDAVSAALRNRDTVTFARLPRMADAAVWIVAAEPACPLERGSFIKALDDQRQEADEFAVEASPLAGAALASLEQHGDLHGTATELLETLSAAATESTRKLPNWPKSAPAFGTRLREVAPNLRRLGVEVEFERSGGKRTITVRRVSIAPETLSLPSSPSQDLLEPSFPGDEPEAMDFADDNKSANHDSDSPMDDSDWDFDERDEPPFETPNEDS